MGAVQRMKFERAQNLRWRPHWIKKELNPTFIIYSEVCEEIQLKKQVQNQWPGYWGSTLAHLYSVCRANTNTGSLGVSGSSESSELYLHSIVKLFIVLWSYLFSGKFLLHGPFKTMKQIFYKMKRINSND